MISSNIKEIQLLAKKLNLHHMSQNYFRLKERNMPNLEFLRMVLEQELNMREQKSRKQKIAKAHLPALKTLDEFNLNVQPSLTQWQLDELKKLNWLDEHYNIVLLGGAGVGKTHIAVALGHFALSRNYKVFFSTLEELVHLLKTKSIIKASASRLTYLLQCNLIIIDEVGYLPIEKEISNLLFQLLNKLYNKASVIITTSVEFGHWGDLLKDEMLANAILDRVTHRSQIINLKGESYRLLDHKNIFNRKVKNKKSKNA